MIPGSPHAITDLLQAWASGDQAALDELLPLVYDELRRQAKRYMRAQPAGHTLQTTALVHEAYLRLVGQSAVVGLAAMAGDADRLTRETLVGSPASDTAVGAESGPHPVSHIAVSMAVPLTRSDRISVSL